jgi:hypothetical protein
MNNEMDDEMNNEMDDEMNNEMDDELDDEMHNSSAVTYSASVRAGSDEYPQLAATPAQQVPGPRVIGGAVVGASAGVD